MSDECAVDVLYSGAVVLGEDVVCDGFRRDAACRVQTHVHSDHMSGFDASKGIQQILLTPGTRELLCAERNADLPYRSNVRPIHYNQSVNVGTSLVSFVPSGHMLGSTQVLVELQCGLRVGYSGDFSWPLGDVIQVDHLVVDSTYGKPTSVRKYSQSECEEQMLALTIEHLGMGRVHILAHRGTLHRALMVLTGSLRHPILANTETLAEIDVYRRNGVPISEVLDVGQDQGRECLSQRQYVWIGRPTRLLPSASGGDVTTIKLSAFFSRSDAPVVEFGPRAFSVALSDHADFDGTLQYVAATGARLVVTDNTRGAGLDLAMALSNRLGIDARPSTNSRELMKPSSS